MKNVLVLFLVMVFCMAGMTGLTAQTKGDITVTILYNHYVHNDGTKADFGFACWVTGPGNNILFDTGTNGDVLMYNFKKLDINPKNTELVVLSHVHSDHTGGLWKFLETNSDVKVFFPYSFPHDVVRKIEKSKAKVAAVNQPVEVCKYAFLTGEMGGFKKEQGLVLDTDKGLVLITGCAHPGVVDMIKKAVEVRKKNVFMVFGGFHLRTKSDDELKEVVAQFKKLGVSKVGVTHCSGDRAIKFFKDAYGKDFVEMGTGRVLTF